MKRLLLTLSLIAAASGAFAQAQRYGYILKDWEFRKGHDIEATEGW